MLTSAKRRRADMLLKELLKLSKAPDVFFNYDLLLLILNFLKIKDIMNSITLINNELYSFFKENTKSISGIKKLITYDFGNIHSVTNFSNINSLDLIKKIYKIFFFQFTKKFKYFRKYP